VATDGVTSVLDVTRLQELEALGERAVVLVDRAIDNFVRGFSPALGDIREAAARGELEDVRARAHRLRGSALNLGLHELAEVGLAIELWEGSTSTCLPELVERLRRAGAAATTALRDYQSVRTRSQRAAS
jgi:HPt (histidine-containing phosphotransfer) domain-containing protein